MSLQDFADWWRGRSLAVRIATVGAVGVTAGVVITLIVLMAGAGGGSASPVVVATPPPTVSPAPTATATATSTPATATPEPTPTAEPTAVASAVATEAPGVPLVRSLSSFVDQFGYPSDATYARIRIPVLGVDSRVASRFVGTDGSMAAPAGPADVVWYDLSLWDGMGGAPGEGGNAIFSGHVDYAAYVPYAQANYRGGGVFEKLHLLSTGDIIEVDRNGETLRYRVVWREQLGANGQTDWGRIWSNSGGVDSVTLYTCGGDWDPVTREYADRVVVRAERI